MPASASRKSVVTVVWSLVLLWLPLAMARLLAADVHVRVDELWTEPADIVVQKGDRVIWDLQVEGARIWDLEGWFEWQTHPTEESKATFSFVYDKPGLYAYEYLRLSTSPPYEPYYGRYYVSRGTVEVKAMPCESPGIALNSPVEGAVFPAVYFPDGTPTAIPGVIPMLASVDATNGLERIEYRLNGEIAEIATNWTAVAFASTSRTGTMTVTARAVYSGGRVVTSAERRVQVVASSDQTADGGVLGAPRHVRGDLYVVEYRTGGGASWYLRQISDMGRNPPSNVAVYTAYLRAYNGGWGRFPFLANEPRQFIWFYRRY